MQKKKKINQSSKIKCNQMYLSFNVTFQLNQKELTAFLSKILSKSSHKPTLRKISCVM